MTPFHTEQLANGLELDFFDRSNRYFGDYWRVCLEVRCRVPVNAAGLSGEETERMRVELGDAVDYVRHLERMGVPTEELPQVRREMVDRFLGTARPYLESPSFPTRLLDSRLAERRRQRRPILVRK